MSTTLFADTSASANLKSHILCTSNSEGSGEIVGTVGVLSACVESKP